MEDLEQPKEPKVVLLETKIPPSESDHLDFHLVELFNPFSIRIFEIYPHRQLVMETLRN